MEEDIYSKWSYLIGNFILEFAHVEVEIFGIFEDFGSKEELENARSAPFKVRANKAMSLIDREFPKEKYFKPAKRAINELIKLADGTRNLIAHNPVEMSLESVFTDTDKYEIRSFRSHEKAITFEELDCKYWELVNWRDELFSCTYKMRHKQTWERNTLA